MKAQPRPKSGVAVTQADFANLWRGAATPRVDRLPSGEWRHSMVTQDRYCRWMQVGQAQVYVVDDFGNLVLVAVEAGPEWR